MRRRVFALALAACGGALACRAKAPPVVEAPAAAPAPALAALWFDEDSGPEMAAAYEQLSDLHFAEYPGLKAPQGYASTVSTSWTSKSTVHIDANGRGGSEQVAVHCLDYSIPGADISVYAEFAQVAKTRGDKVQRLDGALTWQRERPAQRAELSSRPATGGDARQPLVAHWCTDYPPAAGRDKMIEHLVSDWRFAAAIDFAKATSSAASATRYGREGARVFAGAEFSLETPDQVARTRTWLGDHGFASNALELAWSTRVGVTALSVEVSDWNLLPLRVVIVATTPSAPAGSAS